MGALNKLAKLPLLFVVLLPCLLASIPAKTAPADSPHSLFEQSAVQVLNREFSDSNISYVLFDAHSGVLLISRWDNVDKPIPLGSLVKPFTALAYAEAHDFWYPRYNCKGAASGCWRAQPHGELNIVSAISVSCNSYFHSLAQNVSSAELVPVAQDFRLEAPDENIAQAGLIGLGEQWQIAPTHMARAYLELLRRRDQPGVREILAGMAQSAQRGTGAAVGRALKNSDALVKTGTAPCAHSPHAPGDGFVVAVVPAQQPEILLMIRVHGVPGAKAAETAGYMLHRMEE
jgi:cell division protein FtsI/penicillin-binding protein 2